MHALATRPPPTRDARSIAAADLTVAASLIETRGWAERRYRDPETGALGMTAALMEAVDPGFWTAANTGRSDERMDRYGNAMALLREFLVTVMLIRPGPGSTLLQWEDTPGRSADQVTAVLRAASDWAQA